MTLAVDLAGRVALVTGGARGIGRGITEVLVDAGATVVTCGRSDVDDPVPGSEHRTCDVRDPEAVAALVAGIVERHGRLDVLVNNAGGAPYALAADSSPRLDDKILGLNLSSVLTVSKAANAVMQRQPEGGAIVSISSVSALRPSPGTASYGAAKAGADSLTRSLAVEWGPRVRINSIDVGLVRTEQTADHYGDDETVAAVEATIPLGRMARPAEVGRVVAFLASDLASYVSGATVACHGGGEPPVFLHVVTKEQRQ
ncbi:oxidoreductase, short chain dehydrogenase/reductase family protein [Aeromicrobium marinum DSM 15272]|uniref:Oxidoreductase, short chain dehydrogenase/reductase family protein n=1 Tax=Aeromicrobium marinum DSM 15272 TaxID=585531 RepID=E2SEP1_9ACTN|nr:SDR family oxidoreductase [Aeromicrobium marinum]EFQ82338.1 oxidoreductase, short chain dehydrogenase/reductase family protein [Aeromicrobium marinum DSM 15272]